MDISIIGSGYVGLTTGIVLAEKGHKVLCIDKDKSKLQRLKKGELPIYEPGLQELLTKNLKSRSITFGNTITQACNFGTAIFICVPTPTQANGVSDLSFIEDVARNIALNLKALL